MAFIPILCVVATTSLPKLIELVSIFFPSEVLLLRELLFCHLEWVPSLLLIVRERPIVYAHALHHQHEVSLPPVVQPRMLLPSKDCKFFFGDELSKLRPVDSDLLVEVKISLFLVGYLYL